MVLHWLWLSGPCARARPQRSLFLVGVCIRPALSPLRDTRLGFLPWCVCKTNILSTTSQVNRTLGHAQGPSHRSVPCSSQRLGWDWLLLFVITDADLQIGKLMWGDSGLYYCIITTPDDLEGKHEDSVELLVLGKSRPSATSASWTAGMCLLPVLPRARQQDACNLHLLRADSPAVQGLSSCLSGSCFLRATGLSLAMPRTCPLLS